MITASIFIVIAYLIGSLSSAIIVCRLLHLPDPRTQGSNNPGATNVLRIGGKKAALITLVGDILKGFLPVMLAYVFGVRGFMLGLAVVAAVVGHLFPLFFKFQGGKGVATAMGGIFALSWPVGLAVTATWVAVAAIFRYSSLAALAALTLAPIYILWLTNHYAYVIPAAMLSAILIWRHWPNILRLREGTESKISFSS
jgi:acyl phosphate:glycerol-3-phosphate acyltransferase